MRKVGVSILLILTLNSMVFAGGKHVAPPYEPPIAVPMDAFYVGVGLSGLSLRDDASDEEFSALGVMLQVGYQYNQYIAIEGRYTINVGDLEYDNGKTQNPAYDDYPADFSNIGIYLKPMLPMGDLVIYGLLGYGQTKLTNMPLSAGSADRAENGFQWGGGMQYNLGENIVVFADYVRFYDDTGFDYRATTANVVSDAWTLGVSYKF